MVSPVNTSPRPPATSLSREGIASASPKRGPAQAEETFVRGESDSASHAPQDGGEQTGFTEAVTAQIAKFFTDLVDSDAVKEVLKSFEDAGEEGLLASLSSAMGRNPGVEAQNPIREEGAHPDVVIEDITDSHLEKKQATAAASLGAQAESTSTSERKTQTEAPPVQTEGVADAAQPPAAKAKIVQPPQATPTPTGTAETPTAQPPNNNAESPSAPSEGNPPEPPKPGGKKPSLLAAVNGWEKSPVPWYRRAIAFLMPGNLKTGFQAASAVFREKSTSGKVWESALMLGDLALVPLTLGLNVLLALHFPTLQLSDTLRAFGKGVHLGDSGVGKGD